MHAIMYNEFVISYRHHISEENVQLNTNIHHKDAQPYCGSKFSLPSYEQVY